MTFLDFDNDKGLAGQAIDYFDNQKYDDNIRSKIIFDLRFYV